ncbi:hypothetical protein GCM10011247_04000 [Pseudomonas plecoglossicida]|nr:hypothetical protein GCM10011247_04000 [Pseudomonas plecoglossicida]
MNAAKDSATLVPARTLDVRPLLLVTMACTMSMMAFVALIGPIGAAQGMGAVIGPLAGTLVYALDPRLPFLAVALLLLLVGLWPMPRGQQA